MRKMTIEEMEEADAMADAWRESYLLDMIQEELTENEANSATKSL
jgi:hypothetical protein